jgi:uncharacterized protein (DUF2147 family)
MFKDDDLKIGKKTGLFAIVLILIGFGIFVPVMIIGEDADLVESVGKNDVRQIIGSWIRPDGGYVLEIKKIGKDGTLKAAYFNPRSINVARAELNSQTGEATIFVELRDVNYPGSKYNLRYDPKTDRLVGTYFQAVEGVSYNIEFVRNK